MQNLRRDTGNVAGHIFDIGNLSGQRSTFSTEREPFMNRLRKYPNKTDLGATLNLLPVGRGPQHE